MKKLKLLILTIIVFLFGVLNVNAMTLKPTGDSKGKRGDQINVYVTLNRTSEEKNVSAVEGKFSFDSNVFTLVSANSLMENNWTEFSEVTNGGTFSYANLQYNNLISSTSKNIVKVVLKLKDDATYGNTTISVSNPSATDENADGVSISGGSHTVKVLSDVNTLSSLSVEGGNINFDENTTTYDMEIDSDSVKISANKKDSNSTITGDTGSKTLKYGKNTFKVTVTSESGVKKVYTLNITRPDNRSKTNTLSSLKLSEGNIKFSSGTTTYNVTVENKVTSIKVDATLTDSKSSFVSGYGSRTVNLKVGTNVIEVKVKAENESVKTYKINVTRKGDGTKSNNNYLSELKLSSGTLTFDKEELEYRVVVLHDVEKITVEAKTEHNKATYEIKAPEELVVGENTITVLVKAEDTSTREYKIVVVRKEENVELSSNNKLSSLTVTGYELNFNSNVYEYDLKINDEETLEINYEQEDEKSVVVINGNSDLKNGSVITINVTSEDGVTQVYKINIQKEGINFVMIGIIAGVVLLILILIIVISTKSKKKNKPSGNVNNMEELAIKQNVQPIQNPSMNNGMQNVQNIQNMTYTQNPQSIQGMQNPQNMQGMQNNSNVVNPQNNNYQ